MLLRIGDTLINTEHITDVYYNRDAVPGNDKLGFPGTQQSIVIYFVSGKEHTYHGATADALWERLSSDLESVEYDLRF